MAKDLTICEVCGEPTTVFVRDLVEGEPIEHDDGSVERTWLYNGPTHAFCDEHKRKPRMTYATPNESIDAVPAMIGAMRQVAESRDGVTG